MSLQWLLRGKTKMQQQWMIKRKAYREWKLKSQLHKNISSSGMLIFSPACAHTKSSHKSIQLQRPIRPTRFANGKSKIAWNYCHALGWRRQPLQVFGVALRYCQVWRKQGFLQPSIPNKTCHLFAQCNCFASIALPIWRACLVFERFAS